MQYTRKNDRATAGANAAQPQLAPLLGTWYNTNSHSGEIAKLDLLERGDRLLLHAQGADEDAPIDWGEAIATPFVSEPGSSEVTGFEAHYDFGFMETNIAANIKYGVLVIQSYNRFTDDSGRGSYFTREFFHQDVQRVGDVDAVEHGKVAYQMAGDIPIAGGNTAGGLSLSGLLGTWMNTYRHSKCISHVTLTAREDGYYLHAHGVGSPSDWGEIKVTPHAANVDSSVADAFWGQYDFGFLKMFLAANLNKGLLIIASYNSFNDGSDRSSYFARQFFYRKKS